MGIDRRPSAHKAGAYSTDLRASPSGCGKLIWKARTLTWFRSEAGDGGLVEVAVLRGAVFVLAVRQVRFVPSALDLDGEGRELAVNCTTADLLAVRVAQFATCHF